jgi:sugar phosphate permease
LAILWSLATVWSAIAASGAELGYARIALGLTQAGLVPCCIKVVGDWFPLAERGFASAVLTCSMQGGAAIASGLTANLIPLLGWRNVFLVYSVVGILWAISFYIWFRDQPREHRSTNQAEQTLIQDPQSVRDSVPLPEPRPDVDSGSKFGISRTKSLLLVMLTSWSMWAICCQAILRSFGYAFFTSWFPSYLERAYGIQMIRAGTLTVIPLVGVGLGSLLGGLLIDEVLRKTGSRWWSRSGSTAVALTLSAVCTLAATWTTDPFLMVLIVSSGCFISGIANPATWAATIDISGGHSAIAIGVLNTAGNIGALICPIALGYVFSFIEQSRSDWHLVLHLFAGIYFAGAVCWVTLDPSGLALDKP